MEASRNLIDPAREHPNLDFLGLSSRRLDRLRVGKCACRVAVCWNYDKKGRILAEAGRPAGARDRSAIPCHSVVVRAGAAPLAQIEGLCKDLGVRLNLLTATNP